MTSKTTFTQFRRTCIFCGGSGKLTKEHIFGDWLRKIVPRVETRHESFRTIVHALVKGVRIEPKVKEKQGHPGNKRLKIVCATCNNHWLSKNFETPVKPAITDLLTGKNSKLSQDQQRIIALWMVKTCMVAEFDSPETKGIPITDLKYLRETTEIPKGWFVSIGKYSGTDNFQYLHTRVAIIPPDKIDKYEIAQLVQMGNGQRTLLVIGNLILRAINCPVELLDTFEENPFGQNFEKIWPISKDVVNWPSKISVDDKQIRIIEGDDLAPSLE